MFEKLRGIGNKLSPGLRKIVHNIGWLSIEKLLSIILNLSIGIYVIRYLGSDDFGKLSYCLSLVGIVTAIAKLGLDAVVVRNLVRQEKSAPEILGTALVLKLIGSLIALIVLALVVSIWNESAQIYWLSAIIGCKLIFNSSEVIDFWFQSQVASKAIVIVRSIKLILISLAKILFIAWGWGLFAFAWLLLAEDIIRACGTTWIYIRYRSKIDDRHHSNFNWRFNRVRAKEMLQDSYPLILSAVMVTIYMKIDQVMLGNMASTEAVGNYAAAIKFSEVWYFFPTAICASVFPTIIRAKQRSLEEYYDKLQQLYDLMAAMSLTIAIVMTLASDTLVNFLLGTEYTEAGRILAWHIWAGPFVFLGVARSQWLMAENLTKLSFATTSLGAIVNVILNLWLIPLYSGTGAAIATVISYAIAAYFAAALYPVMFTTAWMLTKALLIPFRLRQNLIYLNRVKEFFT